MKLDRDLRELRVMEKQLAEYSDLTRWKAGNPDERPLEMEQWNLGTVV